MKTAVEMIEALRYKLRMFGIPVEGPYNVYCENESVTKNTTIREPMWKKKHHSIAYQRCQESVAAGTVHIAKQGTENNTADFFHKKYYLRAEGIFYWKGSYIDVNEVSHWFKGNVFITRRRFPPWRLFEPAKGDPGKLEF